MDDNTSESQPLSQPCRRLDFDIGDQEASQQVNNQEASKDVLVNTDENLDEEPKVGMEFTSDESAFEFYNSYARKIGFRARKSWVEKSDDGKVILGRKFCCSKEGQRCEKKRTNPPKYTRPITRTQCLARMMIRLQINGKYKVTKFVAEHNHEVITPMKAHMLRSHRGTIDSQKAKADMADDSGITPKATVEFFSKQSGGQENKSFLPIVYKNHLLKKRMKPMKKGDAGKRYKYLCRKLYKIAAMAREHDELFKFADRYADQFQDEVMERMKMMKELPLMSSQADDKSVDTEHAPHEPIRSVDTEDLPSESTESVHTEHAPSEPTESVYTNSARSEPTKSVGIESICLEQTEKQVTFVEVKPRIGGNHHMDKNPLDTVRKKRSRTESIQPQANQEREETAQVSNVMHPASFQPLHYPFTFSALSNSNQEREETAQVSNVMHPASFQPLHYPFTFSALSNSNQGSHITILSPVGLPSGSHAGHCYHMVMGYTPGPSGSMNAPLAQYGYQLPNVSTFQQNLVNIGSQSSSPLSYKNQSLGCEDHNLCSSN